jgi:predicted esterase
MGVRLAVRSLLKYARTSHFYWILRYTPELMRAAMPAIIVLFVSFVLVACKAPQSPPDSMPADAGVSDANATASTDASVDASVDAASVPAAKREIGPFEVPFLGKRNVFFARPSEEAKGQRLIANLHGVCNPPGYACGYWVPAASKLGFLVCPTGNASCGPAMYDAPTWTESYEKMDEDLEKAITTVSELHPGEITREGAILTGFSRGAYAAVRIASAHPGRWPYLALNEADVALDAATLRKAGVRAVAMIAGERSGQVKGERATVKKLEAQAYPAKLWIMPGAGHHYSENIDEIMHEVVTWLLEH